MKSANGNKTGAEGVKWDLSDLYTSTKDKKIDRDIRSTFKKAEAFEKKYRGKINNNKLSASTLLNCIKELESISEKISKVMSYAHLEFAADTSKPEYGAFLQSVQEQATRIRKHLMFFEIEWVALNSKKTNKLIKDRKLSHYSHFLEHERKYKPHTLSEPEEKIMDEKSNTGSRAFKRMFDEVINNIQFEVTLNGKKKTLTETETLAMLYNTDRGSRKAASDGLTEGLERNSHVLTYIFNTLVNDHYTNDRIRGYEHPMQSRNLGNEINMDTVNALIYSCEKNYGLVKDFYKLKKKILKYRKFYDYDRYAPVTSEQKTIKYKDSKEIILEAFNNFSPRMLQIAGMFFDKNWIDAELRAGKRGGAFSHGTVPSVHPYVFTNYTGNLRDVMTLAHELGHGIHQYLSRKQGYFQSDTPLTTAETASVFSEMLVFHKLMEQEQSDKTKLSLLCGKIDDIIATVFRQVVLTRFEERLHNARRKEGELGADKISKLWTDTNREMFGRSVTLTKNYESWWMYIPHFIHVPFYCYAYSFGELLVLALYKKYLNEGRSFVPKYLELLTAGGSESPEKLVKKAGVDITDQDFWQSGLDLTRSMINDAIELSKKVKS